MIKPSDQKRLQRYITERSSVEPNSGCWLWLLSDGNHGYPQGSMPSVTGQRVSLAHRMSYIAFRGDIADGYEVDHLCRNRCCVNPEHLEAVTSHANRSRQYGIKADAHHTASDGCSVCGAQYAVVSGVRVCRDCHSRRNKEYRARRASS